MRGECCWLAILLTLVWADVMGFAPQGLRSRSDENGVVFKFDFGPEIAAPGYTRVPPAEALGPEESRLAFKEGDGTHHNNYGSYALAKCIVEGIKLNQLGLVKYLVSDVKPFNPGRPDPVGSFKVPPSPEIADVKPLGN